MSTALTIEPEPAITESIRDSRQTTCCIVGGGPGGMILALLLARQRVPVTLLEQHKDFDREFRGDTIHPSIMEILDQIGLAEPLHQLRHAKIYGPTVRVANSNFSPVDFRRLKTRFPYIFLVPQAKFLEFLAAEASKYPDFRLMMGANVEQLIEEDGQVRGVRYLGADGMHEMRASLTVGADGRFSRVRHLAGFEPIKTSSPMDILWFRLPHIPGDLPEAEGRVLGGFGAGRMLAVFDRFDYWQVGYVFPKGHYQDLRAAGIESLRQSIAQIEPKLAEHVKSLTDWHQFSLLSVESSRCPRWYKPGLLLIGDAAHVMSPVGGVGINYAVQDATEAANILTAPLRAGRLQVSDLAKVQRRQLMTRYHHATVDGSKIFYREAGPKTAPTVLLLHGFPTSSHMFRNLIPALADRYHVVAPDLPGFGFTEAPDRKQFGYTFENLAKVIDRFTQTIGLDRYAIYVFDYGAPVGLRLALAHPERITAIISQNGNAYEEGLSQGWNPIQKYWKEPTAENRTALRDFLKPEATKWQYTHGVQDESLVAPEAYALDSALLGRPGNDEIQLDLFLDYASNVALYPKFQEYFHTKRPPLLAVWGKNDPFFLPPGAEAFKRDNPNAEVRFYETGHFALETHHQEIAGAIRDFLSRKLTAQVTVA